MRASLFRWLATGYYKLYNIAMSISSNSILDGPLVFVDIETNGLNHVRGRVIEVAAIRVEAGKIVQQFCSLIDPETELPQFITRLTGITPNDIKHAPTFDQIADELVEVLHGAVFVAHNVRFDYSFLKQEFGRLGMVFLPKQLCTVKLSRALHPDVIGHKLADLIKRHNLQYSKRHRAYDDAAVLWQFINYARKQFPAEQVEAAIKLQIRQPALPKAIEPKLIKNLPEAPGVYIFQDEAGRAMYVGKSINIKKRVLSHFGRDHAESKEFKIAQSIHHIETITTSGELSALLLESQLVKELQPLYNRQLRKTKKLTLTKLNKNDAGYLVAYLDEANGITPDEIGSILAVHPGKAKAKRHLVETAKTFDLCPKLLGLEKATGACFLYQLGKCRGACIGKETKELYNQRLRIAFDRQRLRDWPYDSAVVVKEAMPASQIEHGIVVDQWCVIGEITQEAYCAPSVKLYQKIFDLDTYKILQSFLGAKAGNLTVTQLSPSQLQQLRA
jgi:DNA polymerase-3 subunit epsilon